LSNLASILTQLLAMARSISSASDEVRHPNAFSSACRRAEPPINFNL